MGNAGRAGSWENAEEKGLRGEEGVLGALWDTASVPAPVVGDGHRERAEPGALSHCGKRGVRRGGRRCAGLPGGGAGGPPVGLLWG